MSPKPANTSGPGASSRWYVLDRMMPAPAWRASSIEMWRKLARVATGMNTGVGMSPRRVWSTPARAPVAVACSSEKPTLTPAESPRARALSTASVALQRELPERRPGPGVVGIYRCCAGQGDPDIARGHVRGESQRLRHPSAVGHDLLSVDGVVRRGLDQVEVLAIGILELN